MGATRPSRANFPNPSSFIFSQPLGRSCIHVLLQWVSCNSSASLLQSLICIWYVEICLCLHPSSELSHGVNQSLAIIYLMDFCCLSLTLHCKDRLYWIWQLVFESPVWSRSLASKALDRDRDRSLKIPNCQKTEPDLCRPVFSGFFAVTRLVLTSSDHDRFTTGWNRLRPVS